MNFDLVEFLLIQFGRFWFLYWYLLECKVLVYQVFWLKLMESWGNRLLFYLIMDCQCALKKGLRFVLLGRYEALEQELEKTSKRLWIGKLRTNFIQGIIINTKETYSGKPLVFSVLLVGWVLAGSKTVRSTRGLITGSFDSLKQLYEFKEEGKVVYLVVAGPWSILYFCYWSTKCKLVKHVRTHVHSLFRFFFCVL